MGYCTRPIEMHDLGDNLIDFIAHRLGLARSSHKNIPHNVYSMGKTVLHQLHLPDGGSSFVHKLQDIVGEALYTSLNPVETSLGHINQFLFGEV